jgi:acetolactate synthase-1/2/3 large subunit
MNVAEVLCRAIKSRGIKHVFGYSGGANLAILDEIYKTNCKESDESEDYFNTLDSCTTNDWNLWRTRIRESHGTGIQFVTNSNEQCAAHAAVGYSKSSNMTGVAILTSGPGVTNSITALQDAKTDGVPCVMISGQVKRSAIGTDAFQECDAIEITKSCTKWNYFLDNPCDAAEVFDEAFNIAESGRGGPVHIDIPSDVLVELVAHKPPGVRSVFNKNDVSSFIESHHPSNNAANIKQIAKKINNAKRPVIIAGRGVVLSGAHQELRNMAVRGGIPVTTTLHGLGCMDENDELSLEMLGMHGAYAANMAVQNADVIIAIGSRFDDRTTGVLDKYAPYARDGGIIHITNDATEINRVVNCGKYVVGDCRLIIAGLTDNLAWRRQRRDARKEWLNQVAVWKAAQPFRCKVDADDSKIKVQEVVQSLNRYMQSQGEVRGAGGDFSDYIFTTGVGNHQMMLAQFLKWREPGGIITSGSLGVMGTGLPFAIGSQLANPGKTVVVVDGDGSFNMSLTDLKVLMELQLPVKIMIMNDRRMQMVYIWQKLLYGSRYIATETVNPDFVKLAEAYNIKAMVCNSRTNLTKKMEYFMDYTGGPIVMVCDVVPDTCIPFVTPGSALDDMLLESL